MSEIDFIEKFLQKHKELENLTSLQLLAFIIQLHKLIDKLYDMLLKKIIEETRNARTR